MSAEAALNKVRIVLSHTQHPGNIGAAARAMKTMGLSRLFLVAPERFPDREARVFASGALDLLDSATVCVDLAQALQGTVLAVAATTRRRDLSHETLDCRVACDRLLAETSHGDVAIVFGPERSGLTIAEVSQCRLFASIAASEAYSSLNLAQAVQVFAYELRMGALSGQLPEIWGPKPATHEETENFLLQLEASLYSTGFVDPEQPRRLMQRLRRMFARTRLEPEEVNILRGLLKALQGSPDRE
ncbi:MAG: RNA methyltransferase [Burkholderiales bacterium]